MNKEDRLYWLIEDYLAGKLTGEAMQSFEASLQTDPELQQKLRLHKAANELVIERRIAGIKDILAEQKNDTGRPWKNYYTMAGILLLSGLLFLAWNRTQHSKKTTENADTIAAASRTKEVPVPAGPAPAAPQQQDRSSNKKSEPFITDTITDRPNKSDVRVDSTFTPYIDKGQEKETSIPGIKPGAGNKPMLSPCAAALITAVIHATAACEGEDNGAIQVSQIEGGTVPYHITLTDDNNEGHASLLKLKAGRYRLRISDNNGCIREFGQVTVPEKACGKDYQFNPFSGESWEVPEADKPGILKIFDRSGETILEKPIGSGEESTWNGASKTGEINTGYYIFVINYRDGSFLKGSVTIVR